MNERGGLVIGTREHHERGPVVIPFKQLRHHTLLVGQSGSGKSKLLQRIVEEIIARSDARVVVLDPNGDFRNLSSSDWPDQPVGSGWRADALKRIDKLTRAERAGGDGLPAIDSQGVFESIWATRRFVNLEVSNEAESGSAATSSYVAASIADAESGSLISSASNALRERLWIHWSELSEEADYLLHADATSHAHLALGLEACAARSGDGASLEALIKTAAELSDQKKSHKFPDGLAFAAHLDEHQWGAVGAFLRQLRRRHALWWPPSGADDSSGHEPAGLCKQIAGGFRASSDGTEPDPDPLWNALVLGLDAASIPDALLAADVALWSLWENAKKALARAIDAQSVAGERSLRSTFIVIDEAHNFAPATSADPLRVRVTDWLLRVASEGRKYGLFLILATQRPTKLHPGLVPECENSCVLRIQSSAEQEFAATQLGISAEQTKQASAFETGQGLLAGRWALGPAFLLRAAPWRALAIEVGFDDNVQAVANECFAKLGAAAPGVDGAAGTTEHADAAELSATHVVDATLPEAEELPVAETPGGGSEAIEANGTKPVSPDTGHDVLGHVGQVLQDALGGAENHRLKLVTAANVVRTKVPEAGPTGSWLNHGNFKALVEILDIPGFSVSRGADAWLTMNGFVEPANRRLARLGLPPLPCEGYAALFAGLAVGFARSRWWLDPDELRRLSAAASVQGGVVPPIHAAEMGFVQEGLRRSGKVNIRASDQDAATLAQVFYDNTIKWAADKGIELEAAALSELRERIIGPT